MDLHTPHRAGPWGLALLVTSLLGGGCTDALGSSLNAAAQQREARAAIQPLLNRAAERDAAAIQGATADVERLIESRKDNTKDFASELLSLGGKWEYVSRSDEGYARYIGRTFDKTVLSRAELERELATSVANFQHALVEHDNELLLAARADLADFSGVSVPRRLSLPDTMGPQTRSIVGEVRSSTQGEIATEVVATIATRIVASVAARAGASGGILAAGAGTSWASLGLSLGVAVLVDAAFSWFDESEAKVAADTRAALDELTSTVIVGQPGQPGLRPVLRAMAEDRQRAREDALLAAIGDRR
jgi:hypothetical protein